LVLLCFIDLLAPNAVDWKKVNQREENGNALSRSECLVNCHYAISMIKQEPFWRSFNGIESIPNDGLEVFNGNKSLILVIARNLINFHYLRTLTPMMDQKDLVTEQDILKWTNKQLQTAKMLPRFCSSDEKRLNKFNDDSLKSCLYYIDLLMLLMDDPRHDINRDAVIHLNNRQFRSVDYTKSECLDNARYALSIARKFGGIFYISPFDLVEVRSPEITMSFIMCIMVLILERRQKEIPKKRHSRSSSKHNKSRSISKVDALQTHLQAESQSVSVSVGGVGSIIDDHKEDESASGHSKKKSVLQDFGLITDLNELAHIQRTYSVPSAPTPQSTSPPATFPQEEPPRVSEQK